MSVLKIKLCDLNDRDIGSIKSMLHLTQAQRKQTWEIVFSGHADLCVYSFESEKSIAAWQQHDSSQCMSVLFSTNTDVDVVVDMVLKKPLRTKNFSEMLNQAAKQIKSAQNLEDKIPEDTPKPKQQVTNEPTVNKESFINSLSSSLSKHLSRNKSSHRHLPPLNLILPEQSIIEPDLILDPSVLKKSLDEVKNSSDNELISSILDNLIPLNRFVIPAKTRRSILELYRHAAAPLLRRWDTKLTQLELLPNADYIKVTLVLALLLDELSIGYKILIMEAYNKGSHPKTKEEFLIDINLAAQYSSLTILHAYYFLRTAPSGTISTLHQLYLCCEAANVLDAKISLKEEEISLSFSATYNQIILTGIADPFRLTRPNILKLYRLMAKYTTKIKIDSLTAEQKLSANDSLLVGHFFIDVTSDNIPISLDKISEKMRNTSNARLLNTHSVLTAIEIIFQQAANALENDVYSSEIRLLKRIIPHLNTSYERQYERFPFDDGSQVQLVKDIFDIHKGLQADTSYLGDNWNIHNRGLGGMMVSIQNVQSHHFDVGDFYGIFETNDSPLLAVVRWVRITDKNALQMGLELHRGHPVAVSCMIENQTTPLPTLILRNENHADTLIAPKGVINIDQALQLTEIDKTYIINTDTLIDNSFNYDHFSFTVL